MTMCTCCQEDVNATIADLNRIIEEKQETIEHFRKENDKLRCEIVMKKSAIDELEMLRVEDRKTILDQVRTINKFNETLDFEYNHVEELKCKVKDCETAIADLKTLLDDRDNKILVLKDIIKVKDQRIDILNEKLDKIEQTPKETTSYEDKATDLRKRYEALVKAGFDHDSAMSLIPLWWDEG